MDTTPDSTLERHLFLTSQTFSDSASEGRKKKKTLSDRISKHRVAPNSDRLGATAPSESYTQQLSVNDSDRNLPQTTQAQEQTMPVLTRPFRPGVSNTSNGAHASTPPSEQEPPRAERFASKSKALDMTLPETQRIVGAPNKIQPPFGSRRLLLDADEDEEEPELPDEAAPKAPTDWRPSELTNEKPPLPDNATALKKGVSQPASSSGTATGTHPLSPPLRDSPPSPEIASRSNRPPALAANCPSSPDSDPSFPPTFAPPQPSQSNSAPPQPSQSQTVTSGLPPLPSRAQLTAFKQSQQPTPEAATSGIASRFDGGSHAPASGLRARSSSSTGLDSAPNSACGGAFPDGRTRAPGNNSGNLFRTGSALSVASEGAASNISTGSTLRQLTTREAKAK